MGKPKGKAAPRPGVRSITVRIAEGDLAGWECQARADFPARVLDDLGSGNLDRVMDALESILVSWNFPGSDGELAPTLRDVDPFSALVQVAGEALDAIGKLPPR